MIYLITKKQGKSIIIQDKSGECLTEEPEILNRWVEYCSDLYYNEMMGIKRYMTTQTPDLEPLPILQDGVEAAVKALKMERSAELITNQQTKSKLEETP